MHSLRLRRRSVLSFLLAVIGLTVIATAQPPPTRSGDDDPLRSLRRGHPRLLVLDEQLAEVKKSVASDPAAKAYLEHVRNVCDGLIGAPVAQRVLIGPRLLHVSRQTLVRVTSLAGMYRLTGERKYADRAIAEMLAAAAFSDWNPSHFLDTAEMSNALGIGYDWLFDVLTPDQRQTIRTALIEKGLTPGLAAYATKNGWHLRTNNWNQVCNGGLSVGALAIADEEPALARQILTHAKQSLPRAMAAFADGGCIEGPAYWGYATLYIAYYASAMQTALGDTTILDSPGLRETGMFRIQSIGPIDQMFNFADGGETAGTAAQMFYFARAFGVPAYAAHERGRIGHGGNAADAMHLLWFTPAGSGADLAALPPAAKYEGIGVVLMRSAWGDRDAAFVGFKGGDNAASHANLDLGTFIYDVNGHRWATELGPDDYNLPGYFGKQRWTYYRMRTEGQNTLTLDGQNQNVKATSKITAFDLKKRSATVDLTDAYAGQVERASRSIALAGKQLTVTDELAASGPVEVVWHLHTAAKIQIAADGTRAVLSQGDQKVVARIVEPRGARFAIAPSDPAPTEKPNPPMRGEVQRLTEKLTVRFPEKVTALKLKVVLAPG